MIIGASKNIFAKRAELKANKDWLDNENNGAHYVLPKSKQYTCLLSSILLLLLFHSSFVFSSLLENYVSFKDVIGLNESFLISPPLYLSNCIIPYSVIHTKCSHHYLMLRIFTSTRACVLANVYRQANLFIYATNFPFFYK